MKEVRKEKLNSEFKKEITDILQNKVKNPNITEMYTIVDVDTDRELATAKVFVSIFSTDEEKAQKTFEAIKSSAGFIRQSISKSMHIRTIPNFVFVLDKRMEYGQKIDKILSEIGGKNEH